MKAGIVGWPRTGKTTLFRALTHGSAHEASVGAHGEHILTGVVRVHDERFQFLVDHYKPKKATPATIEFVDGAGRITEEERGAKLGKDFFADVRTVDALIHVVRCFTNPPAGLESPPDPVREVELLSEEFILSDLQLIETRLSKLEKSLVSVKHGAVTPETIERDLLLMLKEHLESGKAISAAGLTPDEEKMVRGYDFISLKPLVLVANIGEDRLTGEPSAEVQALRSSGLPLMEICARLEAEIAELPEDEQAEYLEAMGLPEPAVGKVIHEIYRALGLCSFFTLSEAEIRAWTLPEGSHVIEAAAKIHTDMARGFIRAEVGHFDDVKRAGSWEAAKQANLVELHGKEYVVQDGDIIYIRFKA